MKFSDIFHLYDHIADEDDEGNRKGNDETHVDILCSEAGFSIVLFFRFVFKCFFLLVLQWIDLLPVMDHLFRKTNAKVMKGMNQRNSQRSSHKFHTIWSRPIFIPIIITSPCM